MSSIFTGTPDPAADGSNQTDVSRALKQTSEALIKKTEELDAAIAALQAATNTAAPTDAASIITGGTSSGSGVMPLDDAALDAVFNRAVEQAQLYIRQARSDAQGAISALQTALDNFKNGYEDTNAVVNANIYNLQSQVGENTARITEEELTRATQSQALAGRISKITSVVNGNTAAITTEAVTRADADSALAAQITTVQAQTDDNTAAITAEVIARTDADSALATQINTVQAQTNTNTADIATEVLARTTADSALSTQITNVQAQTDAGTANGFYRLVALSTPTDGAAAEFAVEVKASSGDAYYSAGMNIQAFSSGINRIKMRTDRFIVADSSNTYSPFQVITGLNSTTFATQTVHAAVWTGTQFVVGGTNGAIGTSANGDQWTYQGGLTSTLWGVKTVYGLATNGTTLLAVGTLGGAATSTDGVTWTWQAGLSGTTFSTTTANAVVWTGTVFVVGGATGRIATSPDGVTWTYQSSLSGTTWSTTTVLALLWTGTRVVALGDNGWVATSPDGVTWTSRSGLRSTTWGTTAEVRAATYISSLTRIVVVGDGGRVATSDDDGVTWTYRAGLSTTTWGSTNAYALSAQGVQLIVAGADGRVATSTDGGVTWTYVNTLRTSTWGTTADVLCAVSSSTVTLVAGEVGSTAYSTTGATWTNNAGKLGANVVISPSGVIGAQLESLGLMSYYDQITQFNAATLIGVAAIGTAFIGDAAITSAKIGNLEVKTANIDALAVTSAKINNLAVTTAKIDNLAVQTGKIQDLAVETLKIGNNAVTIPVGAYSNTPTYGIAFGTYIPIFTQTITLDYPAKIAVTYMHATVYGFGAKATNSFMKVNGATVVAVPAGGALVPSVSMCYITTTELSAGTHTIEILWEGQDNQVYINSKSLVIQGIKK